MRYLALIADYDGTVASEGRVSEHVIDALQRLKTSGRRVILVTGRRLDDLLAVCPRADIFDAIVAENGGLFYDPGRRQETVLGHPPSKQLLKALRAKGVAPLEVGAGRDRDAGVATHGDPGRALGAWTGSPGDRKPRRHDDLAGGDQQVDRASARPRSTSKRSPTSCPSGSRGGRSLRSTRSSKGFWRAWSLKGATRLMENAPASLRPDWPAHV